MHGSDDLRPKYETLEYIEINEIIKNRWQKLINLMAEALEVPAALIMKVHSYEIEVFISSESKGNVYNPGDREALGYGLYCEHVIDNNKTLLVPNANKDPLWDKNPDLKYGMISYIGMPLFWPSGQIFGTICALDIKENEYSKKYIELLEQFKDMVSADLGIIINNKQIEHHNERLKAILNSTFDSIIVFNFNGEVYDVNNSAYKYLGYIKKDLLSLKISDFICGLDLQWLTNELIKNKTVSCQKKLINSLGKEVDAEIHFSTMILDDQNYIVSTIIDILERKKYELILQKEKADLEITIKEKDRELNNVVACLQNTLTQKDLFLKSVSHELSTSLNAIIGFSQIIETEQYGNLNDRQKEYLGYILENSTGLFNLINDLIEFIVLDSEQIAFSYEPVEINALLNEIKPVIAKLAEQKNIEFTYKTFAKKNIIINADKKKIKQILLNILINAVKFTPVNGNISVNVTRLKESIKIAVKDTGAGLTEEDKQKVFTGYYKAANSFNNAIPGLGVGLSLTKKLVELHKGRIGVKSEPGKGSTFWVCFPR